MILVTGATGQVGGRVAELLAARGAPLRLAARDPSLAPSFPGIAVVKADYGQPRLLDIAFDGVERAFIVSAYAPPMERARLHRNAFEAAARAGLSHIVYLSFQGASAESRFPMSADHHLSERFLAECGVPFTALRDSFYMDQLPTLFDEHGILRGPAADGRVAMVAREDVAQVAAFVLSAPPAASGAHDVTGPEALTLGEAARRLSRLTERELRYVAETPEEARAWRAKLGAPAWEVDTWVGSYEAFAAGELAQVSDTVRRITGREPFRLEEYFTRFPRALGPLGAARQG
jgi:uncharacterized protein YbjT (DUF2867 family)